MIAIDLSKQQAVDPEPARNVEHGLNPDKQVSMLIWKQCNKLFLKEIKIKQKALQCFSLSKK